MHRGYEPSRVASLSQHCRWAIATLDNISSTDPAAADAVAAIARIRSAIVNDFVPAARTVGLVDPLGGSMDRLQIHQLWPPRPSQPPLSPPKSDEQLIDELQEWGDTAPFEALFDPDHPHWDGFDALADEIARRSVDPVTGEISPFGEWLLDTITHLAALPIAVARADFDPVFAVALIETIFDPTAAPSAELHRLEAFGVDLLLASLLDHPEALSELLLREQHDILSGVLDIEDSMFFDLFDSDVVSHQVLADVIAAVLDVEGPVDLADIQLAFALFVQAANTSSFERGFPGPIALALATAFVEVLPNLDEQIRLDQTIFFDEIGDSDDVIKFGEYEDVRDFLGAILVDPAGLVLLYALAARSEAMGRGEIDAGDVNAFGQLLLASFKENLDEIAIAAARDRAEWAAAMAVVSVAVGLGPVGRALGPVGVKFTQAAIKRFGSAAPGAGARHQPNDDVGYLAKLMIQFGSYEGFLDHHDTRSGVGVGGGDGDRSRRARTLLAQAWAQFEAGAPLGTVAETLGDVREQIGELGGEEFLRDEVAAIDHVDPIKKASDLE